MPAPVALGGRGGANPAAKACIVPPDPGGFGEPKGGGRGGLAAGGAGGASGLAAGGAGGASGLAAGGTGGASGLAAGGAGGARGASGPAAGGAVGAGGAGGVAGAAAADPATVAPDGAGTWIVAWHAVQRIRIPLAGIRWSSIVYSFWQPGQLTFIETSFRRFIPEPFPKG